MFCKCFEVLTAVKTSMCLLGRKAMCTCREIGLKRSSTLKKAAVCSSETVVFTYKSTRRYSPGDQHRKSSVSHNTYYHHAPHTEIYFRFQAPAAFNYEKGKIVPLEEEDPCGPEQILSWGTRETHPEFQTASSKHFTDFATPVNLL